MSNTKPSYDFSSTLEKDIPRITETDISNLEDHVERFFYLDNIEKSFNNYKMNLQSEQRKQNQLVSFGKYRSSICLNQQCPYISFISPLCTNCILATYSIEYSVIDDNLFYYSSKISQVYLSKDDFTPLKNLFTPTTIIVQTYEPENKPKNQNSTTQGNIYGMLKKQKPTDDELTAFISTHREFLKNNGGARNMSLNITYSHSYQIISSQLAKTFFGSCKGTKIISTTTSWEEQIQKGLSEFSQFLLLKFHTSPNTVIDLDKQFIETQKACNNQLYFFSPDQHFSKLIPTLYAISHGSILVIKQLAVMLAKIFIGREFLKEMTPNNQLNHLTIIISDNPKYIRDFLMDILSYILSPKNLDYSDPLNVALRRYYPISQFYDVTEHSSKFLCNKENINQLIKEKILGNILNIDTTNTPIDKAIFSKLITGTAITCSSDNIFNDKLTYRSNSHYVKIYQTSNDIPNGSDTIPHDAIICGGKLQNANYDPLDAYELFFLVTGFLNYGISLLGHDLIAESTTNYEKHSIPDPNETIYSFIKEFYIDTFDFKKANHSQKDDSNDFADAEDDIYPRYKEWFNTLYKDISVSNTTKFKDKLKDMYIERKSGKDLKCLTNTEQELELAHRYLKNNKSNHRGISGLKFNETGFETFLNTSQQMTLNISENKTAFGQYMAEIFDNYSPYDY